MRNRTLLLFTLALGLVALALVFTGRETAPAAPEPRPLVPADLLADLRAIEVTANGKTARVERAEQGWVVPARFNLPVDTENRLRPLLQSLRSTKVLGVLTADPRRIARLGLEGSSLRLEGAGGQAWSAEFGRTTDDGLGAAVRLAGAKEALSTGFLGYLEGDPANWIDPVLFTTKPEEIRAIALAFPDGSRLRLERAKDGGQLQGAEPKLLAAAEDLLASLATVRIGDAVARDDAEAVAALAKPFVAELTLRDGATVTLRLAKAAAGKPGEPPRGWLSPAHSDPGHPLNRQAARALFTCPPWLADQIPGSAAELARRMDPPAEPQAPEGSPVRIEAVPR